MRLPLAIVACSGLAVLVASGQSPSTGRTDSTEWRRQYAEYLSLPSAQRERMRLLDEDLLSEDPETQARLRRAMQRYDEWLDRVSDADRRWIEEAPSTSAKLLRVREVREKQWIASLPKADREKIAATASAEGRKELLAKIRKRESEKEIAWQLSETRMEDREEFNRWRREHMRKWLDKELYPKLSSREKKLLQSSVDRGWVDSRTMTAMARKYQVPVPEPLAKYRPSSWRTPFGTPFGRRDR